MASSFNFSIPQSLRAKKQLLMKTPEQSRETVGFNSKFPTHPSAVYTDFDSPGRSIGSRGHKNQLRPLRGSRSSITGTARLIRRRLSQKDHKISAQSSLRTQKNLERSDTDLRIKVSRLGTILSGVDNRFLSAKRKGDKNDDELAQPKKKLMQNVKPKSYTSLSKEDVAKQLKVLIGRVCEQTYDKYLLLEERDKILCKARIKSSDVETAVTVQGTCEDMCSEKERYVRIIQKRVSPYECNDLGEMIPEIAIKEYSRSAADQEEPLPHELRPTHVLQFTMNYLIEKIASSVPSRDENLAEWYDFLWNRTRAIRKDITQQMIVNEVAVILIEQCVRFHIFASHRLCHLGPNEFDQKMNTENLSKSLQSLRYLYDDLAKRGLLCENEAEIRAYDVMLNLEDSNILRQILTYRREIRESLQMRLALRLFSCFKNGNYIRFFKLLKRNATYLQCCLCHRYFNDVRNHALYVMAYSSHEKARYPITKLVDILGFDSINDATEFIMNYNMRVDTITEPDDICILLSKSKFYLSTPPVPKMSLWIEEKRLDTPIAQVLSGGLCSEVILKKPANSFNEQGIYTSDPIISEYIEDFDMEDNKNRYRSVGCDATVSDLQSGIFDVNIVNMVDSAANEIATIVINKEIDNIFADSLNYYITILQISFQLCDELLDSCIQNHAEEVLLSAKLSYNRWKQSEKEKVAQELSYFEKDMSEYLLDVAVAQIVGDICTAVVNENRLKNDRKVFLISSVSDNLGEKLMESVANELIKEIVDSVMKQEVENVQEHLKKIAARLDKLWLKQFVNQWKKYMVKRKEQRDAKQSFLRNFPVIPLPRSQLTIHRRRSSEYRDCTSLDLERKFFLVKIKRSNRIARKALIYWRSWANIQRIKRDFFSKFYHRSATNLLNRPKKCRSKTALANDHLSDLRIVLNEYKPIYSNEYVDKLKIEKMEKNHYDAKEASISPEISNTFHYDIDDSALKLGKEIATANMLRYGLMNNRSYACGLESIFHMRSKSCIDLANMVPQTTQKTSYVDELNEISKKLATFNQQLTEASAEFEKSNHLFKELLGNECE